MLKEQTFTIPELLNSSPFHEVPTVATLTDGQLQHIQAAGETAIKIREQKNGLVNVQTIKAPLTEVIGNLEKDTSTVVYRAIYPHSERRGNKGATTMKYDPKGKIKAGIRIDLNEVGKFLHVTVYDESGRLPIDFGAPEYWDLFHAGAPVLMSDLLSHSPQHFYQKEIVNTVERVRLGDGIDPKDRDQYIVMKLPTPNSQGDKILTQKIQ